MKPFIQESTSQKIYLYGVVFSSNHIRDTYAVTGIDNQPICAIVYKKIAMLGSLLLSKIILPEKKNLLAHHEILKHLSVEETALPMRFGMVSKNEKQVQTFLRHHYLTLYQQLTRLTAKCEMKLSLKWDVNNIFEYFVQRYPELKEARAQLSEKTQPNYREIQIEVGELFSNILTKEREYHTEKMCSLLAPVCEDIISHTPRGEIEIMNLACLINHNNEALFEQTINLAAEQWGGDFLISYAGPLLPYSFVTMAFEL